MAMRKPRKPKHRTEIQQSQTLKELATDIIVDDFSGLKNANIEYVMKTRLNVDDGLIAPPLEKDQTNPGTASAASAVDQSVHHRHFRIQVNGNWWEKATSEQRQALLHHLLCHCWYVDGKPRLVKHDFCGFVSEVRHHGAWTRELRHFEDAMKQQVLPLEPESAGAAEGGEQAKLGLV